VRKYKGILVPRSAQSMSRLILSNITGFVFFWGRGGPLDLRSQDAARWLCCGRQRSAGAFFYRNRDGPLDLRSQIRRGSSCGRCHSAGGIDNGSRLS